MCSSLYALGVTNDILSASPNRVILGKRSMCEGMFLSSVSNTSVFSLMTKPSESLYEPSEKDTTGSQICPGCILSHLSEQQTFQS